jgi:hypothetical protein
MNLDVDSLLAQTGFENTKCLSETLKKLGIVSYSRLQNLPRIWGKPFMCGEGTNDVVMALNAALQAEQAAIPSIDEVPIEPEVAEDKPKSPVVQETPLADIELAGVHESVRGKLSDAGIYTVGDVLKDQGEHLTEIPGIGDSTKERIVDAVKAALEY